MNQSPVIYIPHGGGPLPLLGDPSQREMADFLKTIAADLPKPEAILIISAHWEETVPTATLGRFPPLIYDYYGFPEEAYEIRYPSPGFPELAEETVELIRKSKQDAAVDPERGFDHGMFVPLKLMYPDADIPCIQLSLIRGLNPQAHIDLGKALAPLRERNLLFIGSGMSFHNLRDFFSGRPEGEGKNRQFHDWLLKTCTDKHFSAIERELRLVKWAEAPHARFCHPREDHLLPLHVCFGIASKGNHRAQELFSGSVMGRRVSALRWN